MTAPVQVQILVVPDYPHAAPAAVMVTRLLGELNPSATDVRTTVVTDAQQAAALGFAPPSWSTVSTPSLAQLTRPGWGAGCTGPRRVCRGCPMRTCSALRCPPR